LATGLFNAGGYYRAPYDGGTAFLLITDESIPEISPAVLKDWENRFETFLAANANFSRRYALVDFLVEAADMVQEPNERGSGNISKVLAFVEKLFSGFRGKK
jgi:hypothetical protein